MADGLQEPEGVGRSDGALEKARRLRGLPEQPLQQACLDDFRQECNQVRPHEALGMKTPASRWRPSTPTYDPTPAPRQYLEGAEVQQLDPRGRLWIENRQWQVAGPLAGQHVPLTPLDRRSLVSFLIRELDPARQASTSVEPCPIGPAGKQV